MRMILLLLLACACNNTEYVTTPGEIVEVEKEVVVTETIEVETEVVVIENNTIVEVLTETEIVEIEVEKIIEVSQMFEGFYNLQHGGFIELVANARGDITVEATNQYVLTKNPKNGTICEHPRVYGTDLQIIKGELKWTRNENYTSGHDVEENGSGANITGIKKTDYTVRLFKGKLVLKINIWDDKIGNNINEIIATRTIREY